MSSPDFVTVDDVLQLHEDQISLYGGSMGLRDRGLLESAIDAPRASFGGTYLHADVFEMAAALLTSLVKNHPFVDGNKRVGLVAALLFLELNGFEVQNREPELSELVLSVATSGIDKAGVAAYLRMHAIPLAS